MSKILWTSRDDEISKGLRNRTIRCEKDASFVLDLELDIERRNDFTHNLLFVISFVLLWQTPAS